MSDNEVAPFGDLPIGYKGFVEGFGGYTFDNRFFDSQSRLRAGAYTESEGNHQLELSIDSRYQLVAKEDEITYSVLDLRLYEAYLDNSFEYADLRIGKQIVTWGRSDEIIPLDLANAQDLTRFFLPLREERKFPNWMAKLDGYFDDTTLSALWIPFFMANELADNRQIWAPRIGPFPSTMTVGGMTLPVSVRISEEKPAPQLKNSQYGVKLTRQTEQSIFDLIYFYRWDTMGVLTKETNIGPGGIVIDLRKKYFRDQVFGGSFSTLLGEFVLRGDLAYHFAFPFNTTSPTDDDGIVKKDFTDTCFGAEYSVSDRWFFNFIVNNKSIYNHDPLLTQRRSETSLFGIIDKFWDSKAVRARLLYYYNIDDRDSRVNPELSYEFADGWRVFLGLEFFNGEENTDWGQFDENDQVYIKCKYSF